MAIDSDVERDSEGYLIDPTRWDEALAEALAEETGLSLGAGHWPVLRFVRAYWREHQVTPDVRHVVDFLVETQGFEKRRRRSTCFTSSLWLYAAGLQDRRYAASAGLEHRLISEGRRVSYGQPARAHLLWARGSKR